jgi:hypothetical protein
MEVQRTKTECSKYAIESLIRKEEQTRLALLELKGMLRQISENNACLQPAEEDTGKPLVEIARLEADRIDSTIGEIREAIELIKNGSNSNDGSSYFDAVDALLTSFGLITYTETVNAESGILF